MNKNVVVIGAGGHGKVIADIIIKSQDNVYGFLDDGVDIGTTIIKNKNIKVIGNVEDCKKIASENPDFEFVIAIGNNEIRKTISEKYNLKYYKAIHPSAQIGLDVMVGEGTVVMANTAINSSTQIGQHCIINTGAIIEHDNVIEDYVHISPNATLCGTVKIGKLTHVGAGTVIKNNTNICENCIIGAGATIVKDIKEEGTYVGVPAKKVR